MATNVKLVSATAVAAAVAGGLLVSQLNMGATRAGHQTTRTVSATYQVPAGNARCTHLSNVRSTLAAALSVNTSDIKAILAVRSTGDPSWCWQVGARLASGAELMRQLATGHARCASLDNIANDAVARVDNSGAYDASDVRKIEAVPLEDDDVCWQIEATGVRTGTWVPGEPQ